MPAFYPAKHALIPVTGKKMLKKQFFQIFY